MKPEKNALQGALFSDIRTAKNGGAKRDRTADLLNANQALSQLSYSPILATINYVFIEADAEAA